MFNFFKNRPSPTDHIYHDSYIKDSVLRSNKDMEALRSLVCPSLSNLDRKLLIRSAVTLLDEVSNHALKFKDHMLKAKTARSFFQYAEVFYRDCDRMDAIEKYVYYSEIPSDIMRYQFDQRFQIEIRHLIDRTFSKKNQKNDINAFLDYFYYLDEKSRGKFFKKFKTAELPYMRGVLTKCLILIAQKKQKEINM